MLVSLLNTSVENDLSDGFNIFGQFMLMLFYLVIVVFIIYVVIKVFSRSAYRQNRNANIRVIESVGVGHQIVVQLIKVGNKYYLIGVSKEKISLLTEVDESNIILSEPEKIQFDRFLQKFMKKENTSDD